MKNTPLEHPLRASDLPVNKFARTSRIRPYLDERPARHVERSRRQVAGHTTVAVAHGFGNESGFAGWFAVLAIILPGVTKVTGHQLDQRVLS